MARSRLVGFHRAVFYISNGREGRSGILVLEREGLNLMIVPRLSKAKALIKDAFVDQGRKLGERRRSDTSVFPAVNNADQGLEVYYP